MKKTTNFKKCKKKWEKNKQINCQREIILPPRTLYSLQPPVTAPELGQPENSAEMSEINYQQG